MADGRVLLIAGGSGSIGSVIARIALQHGWRVALHGRSLEKLDSLVTGLSGIGEHLGAEIEGFAADIWEEDAAEALVAEVAEQFGRIDAVIDCIATAPEGVAGPFADTAPDMFGSFLTVSVGWTQRLAHAAYGPLAAQGGTLIALVSDAGIHAAPRQALVGAARAATIGFIRNFALEAAHDGIRAHAIAPSFVERTDSARRLGPERMAAASRRAGLGLPRPEDIAPLVLFLCGPGATKITGQVIAVNGGLNA